MGRMLTGCADPVVTTTACADRSAVIKSSTDPCGGVMTTTALGCRWQVGPMLTSCSEAVVACAARTGYTGVVKTRPEPGVGAVASVTFRRCLWMCWMFTSG